jgi:hypothetical protein
MNQPRIKKWSEVDNGQWHRYIVEGKGTFPFDQLRRNQAFPTTTEDAIKLGSTLPRRIMLTTTEARYVDPKRWESFGWKVVAGFLTGDFSVPTELGEVTV